MRRLVILVLVVPLTIVVIVLSVANRDLVTLAIDPIGSPPAYSLTAPFFIFLFGALALGIFFGGIATWFGQRKWRRAARSERAKAARLSRDLEPTHDTSAASRPALPEPRQGDLTL